MCASVFACSYVCSASNQLSTTGNCQDACTHTHPYMKCITNCFSVIQWEKLHSIASHEKPSKSAVRQITSALIARQKRKINSVPPDTKNTLILFLFLFCSHTLPHQIVLVVCHAHYNYGLFSPVLFFQFRCRIVSIRRYVSVLCICSENLHCSFVANRAHYTILNAFWFAFSARPVFIIVRVPSHPLAQLPHCEKKNFGQPLFRCREMMNISLFRPAFSISMEHCVYV